MQSAAAVQGIHGSGYGHVWRFAEWEFDEYSRELSLHGTAVEIESKPLDVLQQLLLHTGEVVTREELLEAVWPGVRVVDGSLATAVSKLRKTFGNESPIVLTIPRLGYRLGVPVQCRQVAQPVSPSLEFEAGGAVPGRDQWRLVRRVDAGSGSDVWLAENPRTGETRVFKFALDGVRLKSLKREVTLSRLLRDSLGERNDFVRLLEWNFENPPFYFESEYCGLNLAEWAEEQGGLTSIPADVRLKTFVDAAQTVAAAHEAGVLHKDLKPGNILIAPRGEDGWLVRVADFGSGSLLEPARLASLGITNLGFTQTSSTEEMRAVTGTLMYMAPEVLAGQPPTASADVYALGVILYQLLAGDFRKPLAAGWEADIGDPLIRQDIADAACGDIAKRISAVAVLLERLRRLEDRRREQEEAEGVRQRTLRAEQRLASARARRPWVVTAVVALAAGLTASLFIAAKAVKERDRANREASIAAAMNRFLASDLIGRGDPFQSGSSTETLVDAVKQASPRIDREFANEPGIAARLHQAVARALDNRTDYGDARREYEHAEALFVRAEGALSPDAVAVGLQKATMEARTYEKGSLDAARSTLARQEAVLSRTGRVTGETAVWLHSARGMIALIGNDAKRAAAEFGEARHVAEGVSGVDEGALLTLKQKLAFAQIRLGSGAEAERLLRELIAAFTRLNGADSPQVLRVRLNLAQAYMIEGKNKEAIEETTNLYPAYVARLGETHELSMQLLTTRAQCEGAAGLWEGAIRDDLAVYRLAVKKQGPLSFFAISTLSDASLAQCRSGQYGEGEANARRAWEASTKAFGPHAGLTGGVAYGLAACKLGRGQLQEAARLLRDIDVKPVAQLSGFPDWGANVTLALAEIAFREGDYSQARKYLESARPVFLRADAEPYQKQAVSTLIARLEKH